MKILLIEPDKKLAGTYKSALQTAGHTVVTVGHAQDAVHQADHGRPDLVILELQLTAHNGVEFLYEFRSYPEWQEVPVLILTMVAPGSLKITQDMIKNFGIVEILYKPATSLQQLVAAVEEAL